MMIVRIIEEARVGGKYVQVYFLQILRLTTFLWKQNSKILGLYIFY